MAFKGSLKRFRFLSKLGLLAITLIFAANLIFLGDKILYDIEGWVPRLDRESFKSHKELGELDKNEQALDKKLNQLNEERYVIDQSIKQARRIYDSRKKDFENWIQSSRAGVNPNDAQLKEKTSILNNQLKLLEKEEAKLDSFIDREREINKEKRAISDNRFKIQDQDDERFAAAEKIYDIKVFFVRLAFVLPVLLIGLFLFLRYRKHKFRALVWGFILFALYAFFIGLLPYLPSYGGYIKYSVGILLTAFIGYYLIRELTRYTARKEKELEESNEERAKKIQHETAIKAFDTHSCPSCEQDFLKNKWRPQTKKWQDNIDEFEAPDFCRHCGLILFTSCPSCESRNFAHFPYCSSCGGKLSQMELQEEA